jgi:hypothetical protein
VGAPKIFAETSSIFQALNDVEEFDCDKVKMPEIDSIYVQGCIRASLGEAEVKSYHVKQMTASYQYQLTYIEQQEAFLQDVIDELQAQLNAVEEKLQRTPEFVETVESDRRVVADVNYRKSGQKGVSLDDTPRGLDQLEKILRSRKHTDESKADESAGEEGECLIKA